MKYTAIGFWHENQDFSLTRETNSKDPIQVSDMLTKEAGASTKDWLMVVLLLKNGTKGNPPQVVKFWRGENGDFE